MAFDVGAVVARLQLETSGFMAGVTQAQAGTFRLVSALGPAGAATTGWTTALTALGAGAGASAGALSSLEAQAARTVAAIKQGSIVTAGWSQAASGLVVPGHAQAVAGLGKAFETTTTEGIIPGTKATGGFLNGTLRMAGGFALAQVGMMGFTQAGRTLIAMLTKGIGAIDEMEGAAIRLAGTFVDIQPTLNFEEALTGTREMVKTAQRLDAIFSGTGQELVSLTEIAARFGITFDTGTEKGQRGLIVLGELIKKFNPSIEFQRAAFSEIAALAEGQARSGAMLAKALQLQGVNLKEQIPLWIQQGDVGERLSALFPGLTKQLGAQTGLLSVMRSSWESIVSRTLQAGLLPAYDDMVAAQKALNASIFDQNGQLTRTGQIVVGVLQASWQVISATVKGILDILRPFAPLISAAAVGATVLAKGFSVALITIRGIAQALAAVARLDFAGALAAVDQAAADIARVDLPGYFERLAGEQRKAASAGVNLQKATEDQREAFYKTAEGVEYLQEAGKITFDEMIVRLKAMRDATITTTDDGAKAWVDYDRKIRTLEAERTKKAEDEAKKRLDAERKLQTAILEVTGRTLQVSLLQIEDRRKKYVEEAGNIVAAERLAQAERLKVIAEAFQAGRALVLKGTAELLQAQGQSYRAELMNLQEALRDRLKEIASAEMAGRLSAVDAARAQTEAEETARLKGTEVRRRALDDQRIFQEAGIRAVLEVTKDGLAQQLLAIDAGQRQQTEAIAAAVRQRPELEAQGQAQITLIHRAANAARLQAFGQAQAAMLAQLRQLRDAHQAALSEMASTDIRIAKLRAEIAGRGQDEILAAEEEAIRKALAADVLSTKDRMGLAQQLQGVIGQRIQLAGQEEAGQAKIYDLGQRLIEAKKTELGFLVRLREEQKGLVDEQARALSDAGKRLAEFNTTWGPIIQGLQAQAEGVTAAIIDSLGRRAPQDVAAAWKKAVDQIVKDMSRLDPKARQSPSLLDRMRTGLQEAERLMADFSYGPKGAAGGGAAAQAGRVQAVTIPLSIDGRTIGQVALRFLNGELQGWEQRVPG